MATYAKDTRVSVEKSRLEVERTLRRYGADSFFYGQERRQVTVAFEMQGRRVKFTLPMPDIDVFMLTATGKRRTAATQQAAFNQASKQRWRALALAIKAKLESIESGIETFDEAFMPQLVLVDGRTMAEVVAPQIEAGTLKLLAGGK